MPSLHRLLALFALTAITATLAGCSDDDGDATPATPATLITVSTAGTRDIPVRLQAIGRLESRAAPQVAAEVDGRIVKLLVDAGDAIAAGDVIAELDATALTLEQRAAAAERARVAAQLANEQRRVTRLRSLIAKGLIARQMLDDAEAMLAVTRAQRDAADARVRIAADQLARTRIRAPLAGRIEQRLASTGDYVKRGDPVFELATSNQLRAVLPFAETQSSLLARGIAVTLTSPLTPGTPVHGTVSEIRPAVGAGSRAVWAVVDIPNPGTWRPQGTVRGEAVIATHANAVVVPANALVRRPAGDVVYAIHDGKAAQRLVTIGARDDGVIEIATGLAAGETVAVEGAAYLSDGAPVRLAEAQP